MFHWLSSYRYEYALATIPVQVILLAFYLFRRNLPTRTNASFITIMVANLIMTVTDIIACEVLAIWQDIPLWLSYAANMVYFISFTVRGWALFDYAANECHAYSLAGRHGRFLAAIPSLALVGLTLVTPWLHTIFQISPPTGYQTGPMYSAIYYCTYFYIALSTICVVVLRQALSRRQILGVLCCNAILLAGIIIRKQFDHTLVLSYFSMLSVLVIYLTIQNPDLFRNKKTELFNREAFNHIVAELLDQERPFSCLCICIDNYQSMRTLYGPRQLGNGLRLVGRWMRGTFADCHVFYWGNGGYLLLSTDAPKMDWPRVTTKIVQRFEHHWEGEGTTVDLSVSMLGVERPLMPDNPEEIMLLVNQVFRHVAEENSRGSYVACTGLLARIERSKAVEEALGRALDERRLEVHLQPIYSVHEQRVVGAEALARLTDPAMGPIPPNEFIKVAEQNGSIMELGRQVFERVCLFLKDDQAEALGIRRVNVNLSPAQCLNDELAREFADIASAHGVSMDLFDFEVTETLFEDNAAIQRQVLELREHGAVFSLDDFGTGVSNLTRLIDLPVHVIKLDVGVVHSYFEGRLTILPDLVGLIHKAKMKIVLEGVETRQMMDGVEAMGCDYVQGYFFSRPLPPEEFITYLRNLGHQGVTP